MTGAADPLDACYANATRIVRVETLPVYSAASEAERIEAWRTGAPRPVRSVRTSGYLAEVARTTLVEGKLWQRFRVIGPVPTWYQRYQLAGYGEAQAAGEEIFIVPPFPAVLEQGDFTLFDEAAAALQSYDGDGRHTGTRVTMDYGEVAACVGVVRAASSAWAVPLNAYLAAHPGVSRAA